MWNAEVQLRGVTPVHCSSGKKRNRLWWGQFLLVPKKQALSHTDFLPHWTAQNNPRPSSKGKKKEKGRKGAAEVCLKKCLEQLKVDTDFFLQLLVPTWLSLSLLKVLYLQTQTPDKCENYYRTSFYLYCLYSYHHSAKDSYFTVHCCLLSDLCLRGKKQAAIVSWCSSSLSCYNIYFQ